MVVAGEDVLDAQQKEAGDASRCDALCYVDVRLSRIREKDELLAASGPLDAVRCGSSAPSTSNKSSWMVSSLAMSPQANWSCTATLPPSWVGGVIELCVTSQGRPSDATRMLAWIALSKGE